MSKTVTLRLNDETYRKFRQYAENDNRPLSNFIETAAIHFIEDNEFVGEFEMKEIRDNASLNRSIKRGLLDTKKRRGRFV